MDKISPTTRSSSESLHGENSALPVRRKLSFSDDEMRMPITEEEALAALNLSKPYSIHDVTLAYRKRALETHPDKNPETEEQFKIISAAYGILKNIIERDNPETKMPNIANLVRQAFEEQGLLPDQVIAKLELAAKDMEKKILKVAEEQKELAEATLVIQHQRIASMNQAAEQIQQQSTIIQGLQSLLNSFSPSRLGPYFANFRLSPTRTPRTPNNPGLANSSPAQISTSAINQTPTPRSSVAKQLFASPSKLSQGNDPIQTGTLSPPSASPSIPNGVATPVKEKSEIAPAPPKKWGFWPF